MVICSVGAVFFIVVVVICSGDADIVVVVYSIIVEWLGIVSGMVLVCWLWRGCAG